MSAQEPEQNHHRRDEEENGAVDQKPLFVISLVVSGGLLAIPIYALQTDSWQPFVAITAFGMAIAGASLLIGGLVGLLFGIPRRLQQEHLESARETTRSQEGDVQSPALYSGNTNLEQISDWLTKILVGVGLTQISEIGKVMTNIGSVAGKGLGNFTSSNAFSISMIVYFSVSGFLFGYLWTRLYLGRALTAAEREYSLKKKLGKFEQQTYADARALRLSSQQLSSEDVQRPSQPDLDDAIKAASHDTRSHIFYRAQLQRWRNWRQQFTKATMERTIPIFRALIASDTENRYHLNYGQLGYALKDQRKPDWKAAEEALTQAIAIRGDPRSNNYHSYESNRAICRIMQDKAFLENKQAPEEVRSTIMTDIKTAIEDDWVERWVKEDDTIIKWLTLNDLIQAI